MPFVEAELCACGHTEEWEKTALPEDHLIWCPLRQAPVDPRKPLPGQLDLLGGNVKP
jgi:hypothetical protein